jgi:hypothetical protein
VRQLLEQGERVVQVDFLQVHPLIRDLSHYQLPYEPTPNSAP